MTLNTKELDTCRGNCPCDPICPLQKAMTIIDGKWKIPILCALNQDGNLRYNELKRKINGITNTMLAASLKEMEQDQLLIRTQYPEIPVRVEYSISEKGSMLIPILNSLAQWSKELP